MENLSSALKASYRAFPSRPCAADYRVGGACGERATSEGERMFPKQLLAVGFLAVLVEGMMASTHCRRGAGQFKK